MVTGNLPFSAASIEKAYFFYARIVLELVVNMSFHCTRESSENGICYEHAGRGVLQE